MLRCMRTTIRLDERLLAEAKEIAARSGLTLTALIEQALRESFSRRQERREHRPVKLPERRTNRATDGTPCSFRMKSR